MPEPILALKDNIIIIIGLASMLLSLVDGNKISD